MKVNWRRFAGLFVLFTLVLLCTGCTASWIGIAQSLIPAIASALSGLISFILSLEGKTVPASVSAAIQKIVTDIQTELGNVQTLINNVTAGGTTVLGQIDAALNSIMANLKSILAGLSISDSSTLQKITEWVGLAITAVEAILAIVPLAQKELAVEHSQKELAAFDHKLSASLKNTHKTMQSQYQEIVSTMTGEADVDAALAAVVPQALP